MPRVRLAAATLLTLTLLVNVGAVRAQVSFAGIPVARDVDTANAQLPARIARVLGYWSRQALPVFPRTPESRLFTQVALAKLQTQDDIAAINRALLDPKTRPYAGYGTRISVIPGLCARSGDYDFMAEELVRLAHTHLDAPRALWPQTLRKIALELLPEAGARHHARFWLGLCGRFRDTENHVLMTETSRYLTNQLRRRLGDASPRFDNAQNGFDPWLMRHLSRFLRGHFEEYNARPYQGYTVEALSNVYSFAENPQVAESAGLVLDYLSAVFAVQSNGLRRNPPFRRQARYANTPFTHVRDTETARFALLAGNYHYLTPLAGSVPYGEHFMLSAALGRYRVPDTLLDLMIHKRSYLQRLHHDGVEIYASSPSFLISAGGVFVRHFAFGSSEQHGWARATTVMPSRHGGTDTRAWLRVRGNKVAERRNNTCVARGFACGLDVEVPGSIPAACREKLGNLELIDLTGPRCPLDLGFYAAVRTTPCRSAQCAGEAENVGAIEMREASELSFASFRAHVLRQNAGVALRSDGVSTFVTSDGRRFAFDAFAPRSLSPIVSIDGVAQLRSFARWPLAEGDIINARGDGLVTVDNAARRERMVLDARDPLHPKRALVPLDPPAARVPVAAR